MNFPQQPSQPSNHSPPGLNVQHDANHGAVSRNPRVNRLLGLTQSWIGGSSVSWIHQHVVQHHVHTNDLHLDPDITGSDILRWVVGQSDVL